MFIDAIITPTMTRREARRALLDAGWQFIGGGSFAAVYGLPNGDRVAKVTKPDRGADITYEVSQDLPENAHLPTFFGRVPLANGGAVYEVERLEGFDGWGDYGTSREEAEESEAFQEALDALVAHTDYDHIVTDGHWRNAMRRPSDGAFVLTDHIADMDELHNASVSSGQAEAGDFDDCERGGSNHWQDGFIDADLAA